MIKTQSAGSVSFDIEPGCTDRTAWDDYVTKHPAANNYHRYGWRDVIMSLSMLAFAFASMMRDGWKNRIILILSAIPIAMVANIIRIAGTGVLVHFYGDKVAKGFLHEFSGIAIFAFGFITLLGLFNFINRRSSKKENNQKDNETAD